jgi:ring-1,2-phenylacetyl-CoA epoxidase subunit PaaE
MAAPVFARQTKARRRPVFHPLRVARVQQLCEDAAAVSFDIPDDLAAEFAHRPGQSLTLRREIDGRDERRSYSICSPVGSAPCIGIRVVPGGLISSWLVHGIRPGDTIEVLAPSGAFTPDLTEPGHHVLVAAGSGITPMLSIAASVLAADDRSRVTLFYGNRRTDTVMFADELADLKDLHPARFQLVHVLSREPREAEVLSGRLDGERLAALLDALVDVPAIGQWWLCGPHGMIRDARRLLADLGVPADRVHHELFHADDEPLPPVEPVQSVEPVQGVEPVPPGQRARPMGSVEPVEPVQGVEPVEPLRRLRPAAPAVRRREDAPAAGPVSQVTVTLDGRSTTSALPRAHTLLDASQKIRPDLPFACKAGVCGSCRALVTDGRADMRRNYALEPAEVAAGYVLTCQSFPVSDSLTLDFDS